jgi:L-ribulose-5-phosphate 4-epimerase
MEEQEIRKSIIDNCLRLKSIGFVTGTWGNISVRRNDNNMIITLSRIDYDIMKPEDLVIVTLDGKETIGTNNPSSEREVHRLIYNARVDIHAIIHCHSQYVTAAAAIGAPIPAIIEEMCQLIGGEIPVTTRFIPSSHHSELGEETANALGNMNAVLIRNHGPVCCGRDLNETLLTCQVAEKAAMIYIHTNHNNSAKEIPAEAVRDGRDYYLNKYGKENLK